MLRYILQRLVMLVPLVFVISIVIFAIIQLPPGDYLTTYIANLEEQGLTVSEAEAASLRRQYGLDQGVS